MNIDAILQRIQDDAAQFVTQALSAAREKAAQTKTQAETELAREKETVLNQAKAEAGELHDRMMRMAALESRKETLTIKRELIDQAFAQALGTMRAMKPDQARRFHIALLLEAARGEEQLIIDEKDATLFDADFLAQANAALAKAGKPGKLTLSSDHRAMQGGFVLWQSGMEINCSYESVLRTRRAGLEAEVAAALFA